MNASHGFFTLKSNDLDLLYQTLDSLDRIDSIKKDGDLLIAYLKEPLDSSELNKMLFNKGITLSHLVHRKESLEEQFLEITKNLN